MRECEIRMVDQAAMAAGIPLSVPANTVTSACISSNVAAFHGQRTFNNVSSFYNFNFFLKFHDFVEQISVTLFLICGVGAQHII